MKRSHWYCRGDFLLSAKSGASPTDSQDIAQDVLVKLLESDIVLPFEKLRAWLYRSAVRLTLTNTGETRLP